MGIRGHKVQKMLLGQVGFIGINLQLHLISIDAAALHLAAADTATAQSLLPQFFMHHLAQIAHLHPCLNMMGRDIAKEAVNPCIGRNGWLHIHQQIDQFVHRIGLIIARQPAVVEFGASN
jgi:hypothetical protein